LAAGLVALACPALLHAETRTVGRGEDLQAALNSARPGDVLVLEAGAEFVGNFVLPVTAGDEPIVLRSTPSHLLPTQGQRIRPEHAPLLARLRSPNTAAAMRTAPGAHHWELRYLEFPANQNGAGDILQIGDGSSAQNTLDRVPHRLTLSHLYIHGDLLVGQKRCVALNAAHVTIRDSFIAECKGAGQDTQAIGGWNGPGPYTIENNYLEAAGENVMFGGADPAIANLVADGILVRHNHFSRPPSWREPIVNTPATIRASAEAGGSLPAGTYAYRVIARRAVSGGAMARSTATAEAAVASNGGAVRVTWEAVPGATDYRVYGRTAGAQGTFWTVTATTFLDTGAVGSTGAVPTGTGTVWSVKNLFELKNARNVVIRDNIFEHHWKESQAGYAIVFTPRNSGGGCTWCVVEHVRFENNVVRRVSAGVNLLGYDLASRPTQQTRDIVVRNNLFYDVGETYGGPGRVLLIGDEPRDVVIDHNTISHAGTSLMYVYGGTSTDPREIYGVRITNNASRHGEYGINGDVFGYGNGVIHAFFPGATVTANYLAGGPESRYPSGNMFAGQFESEFADPARDDFTLKPDSRLRGAATDGGDIGVNMDLLLPGVDRVERGLQGPNPPATPANLRIVVN
jgi:hypothetical protein